MINKRTLLALFCVFVLLFATALAGGHGGHDDSSSCSSSVPSSSSSQPQSSSSPSCSSEASSTASQGESSSTGVEEPSSSCASSSVPQSSSSSPSCSSSEPQSSSSSCASSSSSQPQSSSSPSCSSSSVPQSSSSSCASSSSQPQSSSSSCASSSSQPQSSSSPSCSSSEPQSSSPSCSSSEPQSSSPSCSSSEPQSSSSPSCSSEESSTASQGESSSTGVEEPSSSCASSSQPQSSSSSSCASSSSQPQSSSSSCSSSEPQSSSSSCASSSSSQPQSSSSSCGSEESSTGSQSQGESSSTGVEESSTGNEEESQDCGRGTYSATGFKPCLPCPNNTYANIRETECTPCPANTHIPDGEVADSLTRCVCDDGYSSLWASGGPCYPSNEVPSYAYCGQRTWSETGNQPCEPCPNNTYANYAETECHSCPDNMHILGGGVGLSLTECVCDDGYTSQWATGGPCYPIGEEQSSSTGEQGQGEESSSSGGGITESSSTGQSNTGECSDHDTELSCTRDSACQAIYAHVCSCGHWKFVGCESKDYCDNSAKNGTCAADSNGDRAWFPTRALPDGWSVVPVNKKCGSCCKPDHQHHPHKPSKNETNVGTGCDFVNGSACVLIEFRGECPATSVLNQWRINIIEAVATIVSEQLNVSRAEATIGLTVGAVPQTAGANSICSVHLQIYPPAVGDLTANDFLMAIWNQLGGDSLISGNDVAGIAGVRTYGDLAAIDEDTDGDITATSGAAVQASVGMMAVATTSVIVSALW